MLRDWAMSYLAGMQPKQDSPEYIPVWQCIGCGRIEAPQTCIGVCRDKKVFVIGKGEHEEALEQLAELRRQLAAARSQLQRFAQCTPKQDQADQAFSALQTQVRVLLKQLPIDVV